MRILVIILVLLVLGCKEENVIKKVFKKNNEKSIKKVDKKGEDTFGDSKSNLKKFEKGKIKTTKILNNGIVIKWIKKSKNRLVKPGEMVLLEYRLALPDGKIIDGNNKLNMPFIPFIVGYNMQTRGWDLAIQELSVGDFAKIEIPADLAYGTKGIEGLIPQNSINWLYVKIHAFVAPGINKDGISSWKLKSGAKSKSSNKNKELFFHTIASTPTKSSIINTYLSNSPFRFKMGQNNVVPGLRNLLLNANKGDKYYVILESKQAYGSRGYLDLIRPNESVLFNIDIIDSREM